MSYKKYLIERTEIINEADISNVLQKITASLGKIPGIQNVLAMLKGNPKDVIKKLYKAAGELNPGEFKNAGKIFSTILKGQPVSENVLYIEGVLSGMRNIKKLVITAVLMSILAGVGGNVFAQAGENASESQYKSAIEQITGGDTGEAQDDLVTDQTYKDVIKQINKSNNVEKRGWDNIETENGKMSIGVGESQDMQTAVDKAQLKAKEAFIRYGHEDEGRIEKTISGLAAQTFKVQNTRNGYIAYAQAYKM